MKYQTLKVGDIRKKGDEVQSKDFDPELNYTWISAPHHWRKTDLVGHEIMGSDLAHLELRRSIR